MARQTKQNDITSKELLAQVNPKNIELLNDFLDYLKSTNKSAGTIGSYKNDIEIAFVWALQRNDNKFFVDWSKRNIVSYQNWLINENGNSPARVRRLKAALSSMSAFIEVVLDDEFPTFRNIIHKIESPALKPVRAKTVLSTEQIETLLQQLVDTGRIRQACLVALAAYSGRRKAELVRFKVSDFGQDHLIYGTLYKSDPILTKGRGGGKSIPCFVLAKKFQPYFDLWMKRREEDRIESEWLFPDNADPTKAMPHTTVNGYMQTCSRLMGLDIYCHSLRHFYATYLRQTGLPDDVIISIIGWEKGSGGQMLAIYDDTDVEDSFSDYFKDGEIIAKTKAGLSGL